MREMKFRAWLIEEKKMVIPESVEEERIWLKGDRGFLTRKFVKLMQFTGLKDKNGKEIFEGDKIKGEYVRGTDEILKINGMVEYQDTQSCYVINDGNVKIPLMYFIDGLEVIGNIFEQGGEK